jgi:hypothetical protein
MDIKLKDANEEISRQRELVQEQIQNVKQVKQDLEEAQNVCAGYICQKLKTIFLIYFLFF